MLSLRHWRSLRLREGGERLGVSKQQIHRIEAGTLATLRHPSMRRAALELASAGSLLRAVLFPNGADEPGLSA